MRYFVEIFTTASEYARFNALEKVIQEHNRVERVLLKNFVLNRNNNK